MKKSLLVLAPLSLLLVANNALAANNGLITITGTVVATSHDTNLSNTSLDLGNIAQTAFVSALTPVASSQRNLSLTLNNCGTPRASQVAQVQVTGPVLPRQNNIFNSDTTRNAGVMLNNVSTSSAHIDNNEVLDIATADATTPNASDFNRQSLNLQAGLASPVTGTRLLTDNGKEFTDRLFASREREPSIKHGFELLYQASGTDHRINNAEDLEQTLMRYVIFFVHQLPQSALQNKTPI